MHVYELSNNFFILKALGKSLIILSYLFISFIIFQAVFQKAKHFFRSYLLFISLFVLLRTVGLTVNLFGLWYPNQLYQVVIDLLSGVVGVWAVVIIHGMLSKFHKMPSITSLQDRNSDLTQELDLQRATNLTPGSELTALADSMQQVVWISDPQGNIIFRNSKWFEILGNKGVLDPLCEEWQSTVHPDDLKSHVQKWKLSLENGIQYRNEMRMLCSDGQYLWFLCKAVPLKSLDNKITKWFGSMRDINDFKIHYNATPLYVN